ncbi:hypothetical protein [Nonomuraea bangladeshensis]|uniref:aromatic-ring hydroxylase C-terminal domain-containing protein n=1 Tax=Nonomuraea bangladeshensis TaxID=404385 RepID=UPI003C2DA48D
MFARSCGAPGLPCSRPRLRVGGSCRRRLLGAPDRSTRASAARGRSHTDAGVTSVARLMHPARPVLLDLAGRADPREAAHDWKDRIDIHTARTDDRPADALLIRPDAHVVWAAPLDEPAGAATPALREALSSWFGSPN